MWGKFKWDMFVTSFMPLWFSILVINIWKVISNSLEIWNDKSSLKSNVVSCYYANSFEIIGCLVIIIIVLISICGINSFINNRKHSKNNSKGKIIKATKINKVSSEFLLAYILPMIAFDFSDLQDVILFIIYFAVLGFLCIRNNNIYTNILLEFKGYKMYNCDIERSVPEGSETYCDSLIISQENLTQMENNSIFYWDFDNYIYIAIKKENKNE